MSRNFRIRYYLHSNFKNSLLKLIFHIVIATDRFKIKFKQNVNLTINVIDSSN